MTFHVRSPFHDFRRYFIGGLLVAFLLVALAWCSGGSRVLIGKDLLAVPWPDTLDFAGEEVPLTTFHVREEWEKQFLILLNQDYQNLLYLKRSAKYFPAIEVELARRDMPDDLKYLAVAESALRETAASGAGAAGIWQFMPTTARDYGLRVDDAVDERLHTDKATNAALTYLTKLHRQFGDWALAAAAYNRGENGLLRDMESQGITDYYDLYLNSETGSYLFRILAIKQIMQDPAAYGYELDEDDYFKIPATRSVSVTEVEDLANWARQQGSTLRAVKELNPWIVGRSLPVGNYAVKVPR